MYCVLGEHHIFLLNNECSLIHGGRQVVCVCSMICICISYVDSQGGSIVYSRMVWGPLFLKGSVIFSLFRGGRLYMIKKTVSIFFRLKHGNAISCCIVAVILIF